MNALSTPPTITGVIGQPARLQISSAGTVIGPESIGRLGWYIAAQDRWYLPERETAVRQRRLEGTPVTETRVRVAGGDVVQHVYSVADRGGATIVEVTNETTAPVAIAFDRRDLMTERPVRSTPIEGIDLGPTAFVAPVAHRASLRVGLAHQRQEPARLGRVANWESVRSGWLDTAGRAGTFGLPDSDASLAASAVAARCDLALVGCAGLDDLIEGADDNDDSTLLFALDQLVRMGLVDVPRQLDAWLADVVAAAERVATGGGWLAEAALGATARLLYAAGEHRGVADVTQLAARNRPTPPPREVPANPLHALVWLERRFVADTQLLPAGIFGSWRGQSFECHDLPSRHDATLSYAVRWHGERPAVLWQQHGHVGELGAAAVDPAWHTEQSAGESLWREPNLS